MTVSHATAVFVDQFANADAGRRELDARITHPSGH